MTNPAVTVDINARLDNLEAGLKDASSQLQRFGDQFSTVGKAVGGLFAIDKIAAFGKATIDAADAWTRVASQIKLVTSSASESARVQADIFDIAQRTRQAYTDLASTYASIARSAGEMGMSNTSLLNLSETISQAVALSGASTQAAQAALVQLGQGLASGALRGEELNSVLEQTPRLARAIADGLGVPIGELRRMGTEGELTAQKVVEALQKSAKKVADEFKQMTPTVAEAWVSLTNAAGKFVAKVDEGTRATRLLAAALTGVSKAIDGIADAMDSRIKQSNRVVREQTLANIDRQLGGLTERDPRYAGLQAQKRFLLGDLAGGMTDGSNDAVTARLGRDALVTGRKPVMSSAAQDVLGRLYGVNKSYQADLRALVDARDSGAMPEDQYIEAVKRLAAANFDKPKAGAKTKPEYAQAGLTPQQESIISGYKALEQLQKRATEATDALAILDEQFFDPKSKMSIETYDSIKNALFKIKDGTSEWGAELDKLRASFDDVLDPLAKYNQKIADAQRLLDQKRISPEQFDTIKASVFEQIGKDFKPVTDKAKDDLDRLNDSAKAFGQIMSSAFEDAIIGGKGFGDVLKGLAQDMARVFLRNTITNPLASAVGNVISGMVLGTAGRGVPATNGTVNGTFLGEGDVLNPVAKSVGSAGPSVVNANTFNVGSGVTRAEVLQLLTQVSSSTEASIADKSARGL